jgi:hypothetical protein
MDSLALNQILVFFTNLVGRHCTKSGKLALTFGAIIGKGFGAYKKTYAIPIVHNSTYRDLQLEKIKSFVDEFIQYAKDNDLYEFIVSDIKEDYPRKDVTEIILLFKDAVNVKNITLPQSFLKILQ